MKKLHILIPSLVATATMPLIGLVGCGKNKEPEPEPVYQDIEMIERSGVVSSDTFDLEKNTYYRIYCTNISSERNWGYFAFEKDLRIYFPVKAEVIKVMRFGLEVEDYEVSSSDERWYLDTFFAYNIEIYLKATIEVKSVCAKIYPDD